MTNQELKKDTPIEKAIVWIGSVQSLWLHTLFFAGNIVIGILHILSWDTVLLVLTTIVSLEAIYLAIFIQMTVNKHTRSLQEVEEDVEDIQEEIEEISEDVEDIQEDDEKDLERRKFQTVTLESLARDMQIIIGELKNKK